MSCLNNEKQLGLRLQMNVNENNGYRRSCLGWWVALLAAFAVTICGPAFASQCAVAEAGVPSAKPRTVVVFGDSIAEGGMLPKSERTNLWVQIVERESVGRLKLVNEGKGGRPTGAVQEFTAMLERRPQADVLVIALGTNDSRDTSDACVPQGVQHLRTMILRAREHYGKALRVLLVGPPNLCKSALGPTRPIADQREAKLRELGVAFEKLAQDLNCDFVPLFGAVPESCLAKDGVHPDSQGNRVIASILLPKLLGGTEQ